jgi:hypothetical protein
MKKTKSTPKTMRPSPSVSATLYPVGKTMRGNDGNLWKIAKTKDGVKRWNKVTAVAKVTKTVMKEPLKRNLTLTAKDKNTFQGFKKVTQLTQSQACFKDTCNYIKTGKHIFPQWKKLYTDVNTSLYGEFVPHESHMRGFAYRLANNLKYNGKTAFVNKILRENGLKIDIGGKEVVKK